MKQPQAAQQAQQRQLTFVLLLILIIMLYRSKPPQQPPTAQQGAPAAQTQTTGAEQVPATLSPAQVQALMAKGAPPYVQDLQLDDPAWAKLAPNEKIAAIRTRINNTTNKDDPNLPKWHLTIAYLYDTMGNRAEAAQEYGEVGRHVMPNQQSKDKAAYLYAGQALLRGAELELQEAQRTGDAKYRNLARKPLDQITNVLQRYGEGAVSLWEWNGHGWQPVADPYGYVLQHVDRITRNSPMYRVLDTLVRICGFGQRTGWSMMLALLLLAVGLKLIMHPLSRKSYRSMAEMQKVQPLIQELQKKYKDQPQKLNQEMMAIYAEHGINPLGGCLPMLVQIPVFIFVYQGIRAYTYNFHHVSFLWIKSLAGPDLALLVVYGISMFVTQWLTMKRQPKPSDPAQAQTQQMMAWFMPIMFTYMMYMWKLPSAFYLYWLAFNIISTTEQMMIHQQVHGTVAHAPGPKPATGGDGPVALTREAAKRPGGGQRTAARAASRKKSNKRRGG